MNFSEGVVFLVQQGAPIHQRFSDEKQAIHVAIEARALESLQALIDHGADPHSSDGQGNSAMTVAEALEDPRFLRALLPD